MHLGEGIVNERKRRELIRIQIVDSVKIDGDYGKTKGAPGNRTMWRAAM